jgi:hypothetical protein
LVEITQLSRDRASIARSGIDLDTGSAEGTLRDKSPPVDSLFAPHARFSAELAF